MNATATNSATNSATDFIDDGYNQTATIEPEQGLHGELNITFRPALAEQTADLIDAGTNDKLYTSRAIDMLPALLLGWTLKDSAGAVVPINRANVARVRRPLLVKVIRTVFFSEAPEASLKN